MAVLPGVPAGHALAVAAVQNADRDEDSPTEAAVAQQIPVPEQKMLQQVKSTKAGAVPIDDGASAKSGRKYQSSWKVKFEWLTYSSMQDKVFCDICQSCSKFDLFRFSTKKDDAFIFSGNDNWKHALEKCSKHENSQCHQEAVIKLANRAKYTNVMGLLSKAHEQERLLARTALLKIATSLQFPCKQGLAIKGHTEATTNFDNLLMLRAADSTELKSWLTRSSYKWTSPQIQNELIEDMALSVLRSYKQELAEAKYFAVMLDESTDISVKEQVSICFRYVSKDLSVHETFVGFYETAATDASTLFDITDDVFKRFELSILNCRGECFDGASNVAGHVSGLQKRITDIEPRALYVHCFSHSLRLAFQDSVSVTSVQGCHESNQRFNQFCT